MRGYRSICIACPLSNNKSGNERGYTGINMYYRTAGKIQNTHVLEPSPNTPHPVAYRVIDKGRPEER